MKSIVKMAILFLIIIFNIIVHAEEYNLIYSEWFDYYPIDVEEFRIQWEDRVENGVTKRYYRVLNNPVVFFDKNDNLVTNTATCVKTYCRTVMLNEYVPNKKETTNEKIEINNPKTLDNIDIYIYIAIGSSTIFLFVNSYKLKETF